MRTTINLDDDVLRVAKTPARECGDSLGAVLSDLAAGSTVAGVPAVALAVWRRYALLLARLPELFRRLGRADD